MNVERSLRVGDRFGGHYVTGHVDGVAAVRSRTQQGDQVLFKIEAPARLLREILPKGSIAVDGISLTVIDLNRQEGWFSFAVIPHTLEWTNLGDKAVESLGVNIETQCLREVGAPGRGRRRAHGGSSETEGADQRLQRRIEAGGMGSENRGDRPGIRRGIRVPTARREAPRPAAPRYDLGGSTARRPTGRSRWGRSSG